MEINKKETSTPFELNTTNSDQNLSDSAEFREIFSMILDKNTSNSLEIQKELEFETPSIHQADLLSDEKSSDEIKTIDIDKMTKNDLKPVDSSEKEYEVSIPNLNEIQMKEIKIEKDELSPNLEKKIILDNQSKEDVKDQSEEILTSSVLNTSILEFEKKDISTGNKEIGKKEKFFSIDEDSTWNKPDVEIFNQSQDNFLKEQLQEIDDRQDIQTRLTNDLSKDNQQELHEDSDTKKTFDTSIQIEVNRYNNIPFERNVQNEIKSIPVPVKEVTTKDVQTNNIDSIVEIISNKSSFEQNEIPSLIKLKLQPENLGNLEIHLSKNNGEITTKFLVETGKVQDLLNNSLKQIEINLLKQNIGIDKMEVVVIENASNSSFDLNQQFSQQNRANKRKFKASTSMDYQQKEMSSNSSEVIASNQIDILV